MRAKFAAATDKAKELLGVRAETRVGFIAAPVAGLLGSIPAYILTRLFAGLVAGGLVFGYLAHRDHETAVRVGAEYQRKADKQRTDNETFLALIVAQAEKDKRQIEASWRDQFIALSESSSHLEDALVAARAAQKGKVSSDCYGPAVTKALRDKAAKANKRYLK